MSARVLFIGLDDAESTLLRAGMASGHLPTLCRLAAVGASVVDFAAVAKARRNAMSKGEESHPHDAGLDFMS